MSVFVAVYACVTFRDNKMILKDKTKKMYEVEKFSDSFIFLSLMVTIKDAHHVCGTLIVTVLSHRQDSH